MLVTQCPRCQESVRVPESVCDSQRASSVEVQCPWCRASLTASEIQAAIPPALVILGDEAELSALPDPIEEESGFGAAAGIASKAGLGAGLGAVASLGMAGDALGLTATAPVTAAASDEIDFPDDVSPTVSSESSQLETVEEIEPVDFGDSYDDGELGGDSEFGGDDELDAVDDLELDDGEFDDGELDKSELDEMPLVAGDGALAEDDDSDLGEFRVPDLDDDAKPSAAAPVMMDIDASRRRRSSGPNFKAIAGVAVGGLLALPIVGGILHVLGKPVPVIGPILNEYIPMGNNAVTRQASLPMPMNPPAVLDDGQPVTGRSLADEMTADELMSDAMAPAEEALAAITDEVTPPSGSGFEMESELPGEFASSEEPATALENLRSLPESLPIEDMAMPSAADDLFSGNDTMAQSDSPETNSLPMPDLNFTPPAILEFDIAAEVDRLNQSLANITSMDNNDPRRADAVDDLYVGLSTVAGNAEASSLEQVRPMLQELATDMSLVKAFALAAPSWVGKTSEDRATDGALVVGKLSGELGNATILLSNKQDVVVTLPENSSEVPGGIQIGLGRINGSGDDKSISLEILQGLQP